MGRAFDLTPQDVPAVETKYRRIRTKIPVPESLPILEQLRKYEPRSMTGQPPVVWDRAEGVQVHDKWGNTWLDFSSGVLVANAGHGHPAIRKAMKAAIDRPLLHNYCFPHELRAEFARRLVEKAPAPLAKCFILTTGGETTENAIKLARTWGAKTGGAKKTVVVTFENAFHGRTLGSQMAGGIPGLKGWIGPTADTGFVQVPYPADPRCTRRSFDDFEAVLSENGVSPADVCLVMSETYQGVTAAFLEPDYAKKLRAWCDKHGALLCFDEVQAGFGRCGTFFGFEHYGVVPDLACFGKGISSGMPLSAVLGREDVMNQYEPGSMTSTHTGNPVCVSAALGSLDAIENEGLVENAARMGETMLAGIRKLHEEHTDATLPVTGKGLVATLHFVKPKTDMDPDPDLAFRVVEKCMQKGLLFFSAVGYMGASLKFAPPLVVNGDHLADGFAALREAIKEARG